MVIGIRGLVLGGMIYYCYYGKDSANPRLLVLKSPAQGRHSNVVDVTRLSQCDFESLCIDQSYNIRVATASAVWR